MRYVFSGDKKDGADGIFKISFDILINESNLIKIFENLLTWKEDESHEFWGFIFYDEYDDPIDEVTVRYLDEEKKYSKSEFRHLLIMAIERFFSMYPDPEGREEISKIINFTEM
ncbi:MAG TPA: hypothetical protein V6D15_11640 [Oculatellaceae cyanobacterium]|jgi:hypothetical protein